MLSHAEWLTMTFNPGSKYRSVCPIGAFEMNQEEVADFLAESRIAVMATINRDARPS